MLAFRIEKENEESEKLCLVYDLYNNRGFALEPPRIHVPSLYEMFLLVLVQGYELLYSKPQRIMR
jgi:hypothetical protein